VQLANCQNFLSISNMEKYGLIGGLRALPGKAGELEKILLSAAELMKNAKGCQSYLVGRSIENGNLIEVIEVWDSKQDHDSSLNYPGVKELISKAMPQLDGPPEKGREIKLSGGYGLS
jgi:quinol monooxygenase YgiN